MNRIYKTTWNEQTGTYVAVSENTKARGKRSSRKAAVGLSAAAFSLFFASGSAQAANNLVNACTGVSLPTSVVTQILTPLVNQLNSIPIIGGLINLGGVTSGSPISVSALTTGGAAVDTTQPCISQNNGFSMTTPAGIAFGGNMITGLGNGSTANAGEIDSIAIGNNAATDATALKSIAIGTNASVAANATNAVALGSGATASTANSVALGAGSTTSAAVATTGTTIAGNSYTFAGGAPAGVVSVGSVGNERQIQNVAAGRVTATSTDAINGSELFATNQAIGKLNTGGAGPVQYSNAATPTTPNGGAPSQDLTLVGAAAGAVGLHNVASGNLLPGSTDAVNGGQLNTVGSSTAANLGGGSVFNPATGQVTAPGYTVQGSTYNNVGGALGAVDTNLTTLNTNVNNINNGGGIKYFHANSILPDSQATGTDSVAIGPNAVSANANSVALGAGSTTSAAVATTGTTIAGNSYTFAGGAPAGVVSVGSVGNERQIQNVAAGRVTATSTDAINGSELFATNQAIGKLNTGGAGPVQYSNAATPTTPNGGAPSQDLTLVGAAAGSVGLHNVASGNLLPGSTDAVNGGQLNTVGSSTATNLGGGSVFNPATGQVTAPGYTVQGSTYNNVGGALGAVDTNLTTLNTNVNNINNGGGIKYFHANSILPDSQATGTDSVAIGPNSVSANANSVALGASSTTSVGAQTSYAAYGLTALQNSVGEVSVGSAGNARKITNVAAGSAATDAVNVSQLQAVDSKLNNVATDALSWDPTANGGAGAFNAKHNGTGPNKITNVAAGDVSATSTDAVNGSQLFSLVGNTSTSYTSTNGTGVRYARTNDTGLTPDDAYAQGVGSTAVGYQATASAADSLALGNGAKASFANSIALGAGSVDTVGALNNYAAYGLASPSSSSGELNIGNRQITGLAPGKNDTDAVNVEQLKAALANNNSGSSGGGGGNSGGNGGGTSTGKNPVTYDDAGKTSITANPGGAPAQLHNVANGVANNDAVNVGQLNTGVSSAVSQANSYTDSKLQNMQGNIDKNQHDADGGTAAAMAVAGLPQPSAPGKSMVSLAGSTYQGQSGMALGISTISEGGSWIYKVAATSSSRGKSGAVVGAGFQW